MKITADITPLKILNINMKENGEILMLSIPLKDNVVDLSDELIFTMYDKDGKILNGGTKKNSEIFNLFRKTI